MSLAVRPPSPQEKLVQTLQRSDSFSSTDSVEMRVEGYVRALKVNEEQLPKVKYSPLISISLSDVCRAATCCFQSKCCVSEQILVASPSKDGVVFHSQKPTEELSSDINQLTNASFFADLYRTHQDFLPYLMASAIAYLPSKELKEFWRNWDPKSSLPLDLNKAIMFRDLLNQAHQVMNEVRVQMMKQDMLNMFASAQTKNIQKIAERSLISTREGSLLRPRMAHTHNYSDIEPAPSKIADVHQLSTRVEKMSLSSSASKSIHCKGVERPFDRERLVQDIQSISGCSKKKAGEIAREVEEMIFEGCTTEELWEILRLKMENFK